MRWKLSVGPIEARRDDPEDIKAKKLWPAGFHPLPHPHHEVGGMVFDDSVEFFNVVLGTKMTADEKKDLVAFLRSL